MKNKVVSYESLIKGRVFSQRIVEEEIRKAKKAGNDTKQLQAEYNQLVDDEMRFRLANSTISKQTVLV